MTELLVTIQMSFPSLDRGALAEHIAPVVMTAIAAGGGSTSVSVQEYEPEEQDG